LKGRGKSHEVNELWVTRVKPSRDAKTTARLTDLEK
jgi:hypothetical protein